MFRWRFPAPPYKSAFLWGGEEGWDLNLKLNIKYVRTVYESAQPIWSINVVIERESRGRHLRKCALNLLSPS